MLQALLSLIAPPRSLRGVLGCALTEAEGRALRALGPLLLEGGALRRRGVRHIDSVLAGARYGASPLLRAAIRRWKYRNGRAYADACIPPALRAVRLRPPRGATLCPVPLHWSRRWMRGFNQADVLAQGIATAESLPVVSLLHRRRPTGAQARRSRSDRREALRDAFTVRGPVPAHVVLVDDVLTTGATLDACALALRDAGARRVDAIVIAA